MEENSHYNEDQSGTRPSVIKNTTKRQMNLVYTERISFIQLLIKESPPNDILFVFPLHPLLWETIGDSHKPICRLFHHDGKKFYSSSLPTSHRGLRAANCTSGVLTLCTSDAVTVVNSGAQ